MNTIMKGDIERYYHRFTAKSFVMLSEGDQKLNTIKQNVFFFRNAYCNGLTIFTRSPINQEDNVIKEISDRKLLTMCQDSSSKIKYSITLCFSIYQLLQSH